MLSEQAILDAEGCPPEIRRLADFPWEFVGLFPYAPPCQVKPCACAMRAQFWDEYTAVTADTPFCYVSMPCHQLHLVDDYDQTFVYIGQCPRCRKVYWAVSILQS